MRFIKQFNVRLLLAVLFEIAVMETNQICNYRTSIKVFGTMKSMQL